MRVLSTAVLPRTSVTRAYSGGSPGDSGEIVVRQQGYINGLAYDPNALGGDAKPDALLRAADLIRGISLYSNKAN